MSKHPIHSIYDKQGNAVVNMVVTEGDNLLDTYSDIDGIDIDSSVGQYIIDHSMQYKPHQHIVLNIISSHLHHNSAKRYQDAICRYFGRQHYVAKNVATRHIMMGLVLALVGVLGFVLLAVAKQQQWHQLLTMFVEIFVWVFWWESVDVLFIHSTTQWINVRRLKALSNLTVRISTRI